LNEETIREYIGRQEEEDKKLDQFRMFDEETLPSGSQRLLTALSDSRERRYEDRDGTLRQHVSGRESSETVAGFSWKAIDLQRS
jgi:hypothetical protein